MKEIGFKNQEKVVKAEIPQNFTFEYMGDIYEVCPVVNIAQQQEFMNTVRQIVIGPNNEYYTYLLEFAVRFASICTFVTNIKIDKTQIFEKHYFFTQYTGFYDALCNALRANECSSALTNLYNSTCSYIDNLIEANCKSQVDLLVENVLLKASVWLDSMSNNATPEDMNKVIKAADVLSKLSNEDETVTKLLNIHNSKKDGGEKNGHKAKSPRAKAD